MDTEPLNSIDVGQFKYRLIGEFVSMYWKIEVFLKQRASSVYRWLFE